MVFCLSSIKFSCTRNVVIKLNKITCYYKTICLIRSISIVYMIFLLSLLMSCVDKLNNWYFFWYFVIDGGLMVLFSDVVYLWSISFRNLRFCLGL
jgi:hypothetical protein